MVIARYSFTNSLRYAFFVVPLHLDMQHNRFTTHEYGRTELACLYAPDLTPQSAWRKLRMWISLNSDLTMRLAELGYDGRRRSFTPRQVAAIAAYLGEP